MEISRGFNNCLHLVEKLQLTGSTSSWVAGGLFSTRTASLTKDNKHSWRFHERHLDCLRLSGFKKYTGFLSTRPDITKLPLVNCCVSKCGQVSKYTYFQTSVKKNKPLKLTDYSLTYILFLELNSLFFSLFIFNLQTLRWNILVQKCHFIYLIFYWLQL